MPTATYTWLYKSVVCYCYLKFTFTTEIVFKHPHISLFCLKIVYTSTILALFRRVLWRIPPQLHTYSWLLDRMFEAKNCHRHHLGWKRVRSRVTRRWRRGQNRRNRSRKWTQFENSRPWYDIIVHDQHFLHKMISNIWNIIYLPTLHLLWCFSQSMWSEFRPY